MTAVWLLFTCAWKAVLLVGLGGLLLRLWPRSSASERHAAWGVVFLALLALPVFSLFWSMVPLPAGNGSAQQALGLVNERMAVTVFGTDGNGAEMEFLRNVAALAGIGWALGAFAALLRLGLSHVRVRRYFHGSRVFVPTEEVWRDRMPFPIVLSPLASMPMAVGFSRRCIVLPIEGPAWEAGQLRRVLLHEAAHLQRNDPLWKLIASLVAALYWFHPVVRLALRTFDSEREKACDDLVLAAGVQPSHYANDLLEFARSAASGSTAAAIPLVSSTGLEARIAAILDDSRPRQNLRSNNMIVYACALAVFVMPLSAFMSAAQSPAPGDLRADYHGNLSASRQSVQAAPTMMPAIPAPEPVAAAQNEPPSRIRVAGDVQKAKLIKQVTPKYPAEAKAEGVSGLVRLNVHIDKEGLVKKTEVEESPDKRLTTSAVEAVSQWVYTPTLLNGNPVDVLTTVDVTFSLKK